MKFTVLSDLKNTPIYEGMEIDYLVSPVLGIPLKWKTRITQVNYKKVLQIYRQKVRIDIGIIIMNLLKMIKVS